MVACYHCGLPADDTIVTNVQGEARVFCCHGCKLVAQAIHQGGLDNYYRFRDTPAAKPNQFADDFIGYDLPEVQREFVRVDESGCKTARLDIQGISCAACAWLIEHHLQNQPSVESARVNATSRTCLLRWNPNEQPLSHLMAALQTIGYRPQPSRQQERDASRRRESQHYMMRLGVAGIGMMQVGMVAVALYAGGIQGIESHWESFLRWVSLVIATPVVVFSAQPFFMSAWRALRARHLNMDVSVSLAIGLAYLASAWATLTHTGEVYFDSVSMFTFFLLLGRFLEMRARHSSAFAQENLQQLLPLTATRVNNGEHHSVPLAALTQGATVWVNAGDVIPADGVLLSSRAYLDESLLTGESVAQQKNTGDVLAAGTLNAGAAVEMTVTAIGENTQLSAIERLVELADMEKPRQVALADRIARWFVAAVLIVAVCVGLAWWFIDPDKTIWVVLSVLVVTCPCALSLATPAALTAGVNRARKLGLLISGAQTLEVLSKVDIVAFDKTGTLTEGKLRISKTVMIADENEENVSFYLEVIAVLEKYSQHPIASAFEKTPTQCVALNVSVHQGEGVAGEVSACRYRFGNTGFALNNPENLTAPSEDGMWQLLSKESGEHMLPLLWVCLDDDVRDSACESVQRLQKSVDVVMLSGDRQQPVRTVAETLRIPQYVSQAKPAEKLAWVQQQQKSNKHVLMVGDGINDVPVLSSADVSMAMGSATRMAQSKADSVLLHGNLLAIPESLALAGKVQKIVRQNLGWALLYNMLALPAAAAGILPPWLAAIGMSLSSLIVVLNATRV